MNSNVKNMKLPQYQNLKVKCIGFEPMTPTLSRWCSEPTELTLLNYDPNVKYFMNTSLILEEQKTLIYKYRCKSVF